MTLILIILGLIIGSFLNVVIYRLPKGESIAYPPSACQTCGYKLKPYDNIPVVSYVLLGGKCRKCSSRISMQYPIIEIFTGVIFGLLYLRTGLSLQLVFELALASSMLCLVVIDLEHQIIPDSLNLFIAVLGVGRILMLGDLSWTTALYGGLAGGGFLFLIALVGPMGGGDIKFMAAAGLWLGLFPTVLSLLVAFTAGGVIGMILIVLKIKSRKDYIPFGPFLVIGVTIGYFFFEEFLMMYFNLIY